MRDVARCASFRAEDTSCSYREQILASFFDLETLSDSYVESSVDRDNEGLPEILLAPRENDSQDASVDCSSKPRYSLNANNLLENS